MAFVPEIKYDDIIKKFDEWYCGVWYNHEDYGTGRIKFGDVIDVDWSDFDQSENVGEENALEIIPLTYSNGVYYKMSLWIDSDSSTEPLNCLIRAYKSDGTPISGIGYNNVRFSMHASIDDTSVYYGLYPDMSNIPMKLAFLTNYYDGNHAPIQDVTRPTNFRLMLYVPTKVRADFGMDYHNYLTNVQSNAFLAYDYDEDFNQNLKNEQNMLIDYWIFAVDDVDDLIEKIEVGGKLDNTYEVDTPDSPSQDTDPSTPGGGGGEYTGGSPVGGYDNKSDPIDFPDLPIGGALSTGSVKGFVVTPVAIDFMFNQLWNTSVFDVSTWQKLVESPLDSLISLHVLPFEPQLSGQEPIHLGNFSFDDAILGDVISGQYVSIYGGSITVKPYWASALDFSPYTKISIFLPFIGIRDLRPEDVVSMKLQVQYNIDVLTGDLVAFIKCGMSVLYKFNGNCRGDIPVTSKVFEGIANMFKGMATVGGGAAIAGALSNPAIGVGSLLLAGVTTAMSKTHINRSGSITGVPGLLDDFEPYLIVHRPIQSLAKDFRKYKGYPCNVTYKLSSLSGYTEVEYIHLKNIPGATSDEMAEIEKLLKQGVII